MAENTAPGAIPFSALLRRMGKLLAKRKGLSSRRGVRHLQKKNQRSLLSQRYAAIQNVITKSGGTGNLNLAAFGFTTPTGPLDDASVLGIADRILAQGGKLQSDPHFADRIIATEKSAAKARGQTAISNRFRKEFFGGGSQ